MCSQKHVNNQRHELMHSVSDYYPSWLNLSQVSQLKRTWCLLPEVFVSAYVWLARKEVIVRSQPVGLYSDLIVREQEVKWFAIWYYIAAWKRQTLQKDRSTPILLLHFYLWPTTCKTSAALCVWRSLPTCLHASSNMDLINTKLTSSVSSRLHNQPLPACLSLFAEYLLISIRIGSRGRLIRRALNSAPEIQLQKIE